jgi:hypothetical protein
MWPDDPDLGGDPDELIPPPEPPPGPDGWRESVAGAWRWMTNPLPGTISTSPTE